MDTLSILMNSGLTEREAEVYLALLRMGSVSVGTLAEKLNIHRQSVYHAMNTLEERDLVTIDVVNGQKKFQASNPEVLLQQNEQQQLLLQKIVPQLQLEEGADQHVSDIKVYSGVTAFQRFLYQQLQRLPEGSSVDGINVGGNNFLDIMNQRHFFRNYENLRIQKKIQHRLLHYIPKKEVDSAYTQRRYVEARFFPQPMQEPPVTTVLWPDSVSLLLFGENPQIIHIRSKRICDGFRVYFKAMWDIAV